MLVAYFEYCSGQDCLSPLRMLGSVTKAGSTMTTTGEFRSDGHRFTKSATVSTASTAISAIVLWHLFTILRAVIAKWISGSLLSKEIGNGLAIESICLITHCAASSTHRQYELDEFPGLRSRRPVTARAAPSACRSRDLHLSASKWLRHRW